MTQICSQVAGVAFHVPERMVSNDDLTKLMDTSDDWIRERTGIHTRYIADEGTGTSDLGAAAAKKALAAAGINASELDLILAATLSPDYYFPGIGVMIQHKIGATAPALDLRGQCSGFTWGLSAADAFMRTGLYKKVLVVGAEIHSRVVEFSTRGRDVSVLFGDGAGAAVLQATTAPERPAASNKIRGIIDSYMGSDGSGAEVLLVKRPGMHGPKSFITPEEAADRAYNPIMDGRQVYRNAVTRMIEAAEVLLKRNGLTSADLDLVVPHQANIRINEMVRQKLELPPEKVVNNIHKYGNTTAATLPICMTEAVADGRLKPGSLVLTLAFGSGFTWGGNLIRW